MNRCTFLRSTSAAVGAVALTSQFEQPTLAKTVEGAATFRRPKVILPVPMASAWYQKVQPDVPNTQLTREATGLSTRVQQLVANVRNCGIRVMELF